jgi:hypothetical protein
MFGCDLKRSAAGRVKAERKENRKSHKVTF